MGHKRLYNIRLGCLPLEKSVWHISLGKECKVPFSFWNLASEHALVWSWVWSFTTFPQMITTWQLGFWSFFFVKVRSHSEGNGNDCVAHLFIPSRFSMVMETILSWMGSVQTNRGDHMVTDGNANGNGKVACVCIWHCFFPLPLPSQNVSTTHLTMIPLPL